MWGEEQELAYAQLKRALTVPGLVLRHPDPANTYHLYTDWSVKGIAAVLNQRTPDGQEYMVACTSRSLNEHEARYEAWKGEMLAAVWGVKSFRPYLHGVHFFLHTDHRPLLWLLTAKEPSGQQARWVLSLQEYQYSLVHKQGKSNIADLPSRFPQDTLTDTTGARLNATGEPLQHPLPDVFHADGRPDTANHTHELLTQLREAEAGRPGNAVTAALLMHADAAPSGTQQDYLLWEHAAACMTDPMDAYAPTPAALLTGSNGGLSDHPGARQQDDHPWAVWRRDRLRQHAREWVSAAKSLLPGMHVPPSRPTLLVGEADGWGVRRATQLSTAAVADTFFPASQRGVVLLEPFGGLCAGLEMLLRNGTAIHQYHYLDINPVAREVAAHRVADLTGCTLPYVAALVCNPRRFCHAAGHPAAHHRAAGQGGRQGPQPSLDGGWRLAVSGHVSGRQGCRHEG